MTTSTLAVVQADSVIVSLTRASLALTEARTIQQTKKVVDVARAAEIYARRQQLGDEAEQMALSIKIEALRKLGEILKSTPKAKGAQTVGGDKRSGGTILVPPEDAQTLADLGLTKKESALAQKLASLPDESFEQVRDGAVSLAKAVKAVEAAKPAKKTAEPAKPKKAAKPEPDTSRLDDAYGDTDILTELVMAQKEIIRLNELLAAAEADDLKAETIKWRRAYENATQQQSAAMDNAARAQKREVWAVRQLQRCGKAIGETDPEKIAAVVEAACRARAVA